ncbi:MAG: 50S ribosomal protein L6, partial [Planctomycetota bacterium]
MSRIGKKPISVPGNVKVAINASDRTIGVDGPKGKLSFNFRPEVDVAWNEDDKEIVCSIDEALMKSKPARAQWGTTRSRIQNMVEGVTNGYMKKIEIVGVGWNAQAQGKTLRLNIGYCHPIDMTPPEGVDFAIDAQVVTITGPDKQAVGQFAAECRSKR